MNLGECGLTIEDLKVGGIDAESDRHLSEHFLTTLHVESAFQGRRTQFLGRKGSGKSALFTQLPRLAQEMGHSEFEVVKITPDQYAWNALTNYVEQGILPDQAHTNAWKLTIAIEAAGTLVSLDREWEGDAKSAIDTLKRFLQENFGELRPGVTKAANAVLRGLTSFNLSAFGFGVGMSRENFDPRPMTPAIVAAVFEVISRAASQRGLLIELDRLDDSWNGEDASISLMIGLLKAAKDINDSYCRDLPMIGIRVLVFLRSDIYDVLEFDDKDKHRALEEHISWTPEELKEMFQCRLPEHVSVDELFSPGEMRGSISPFSYIVKRTFLRPREVLQYFEAMLSVSDKTKSQFSKDDVRAAEDRYSSWKVDDLKQEYRRVFPEFDSLLECLRQGGHRYESINQLQAMFEAKVPELVRERSARTLVDVLFETSVIGVRLSDQGATRFKCEDPDLALPASGAVYVHQSLYRGLSIRETRATSPIDATDTVQDQATIALLGLMMPVTAIQDLTFLQLNPSPIDVFRNPSFMECAKALGIDLIIEDEAPRTSTILRPNFIHKSRYIYDSQSYVDLRSKMMAVLESYGITVHDYEKGESNN
jgi:hypothetical protein